MPTDTVYSLVYPQHYQQYGFDTTASGWNARNVFQLFSEFDYIMFGHKTFKVTDGRIFGYDEEDTLKVTRHAQTGNKTGIQGDSFIEVCMTYTVQMPLQCPVFYRGSGSVLTELGCSSNTTEVEVCNTFWIGDDPGPLPGGGGGSGSGGGTGGGGTGGGGNGGGPVWPEQPQCPVQPRGVVTEVINVIPCPTGWVPDPNSSYDPDLDPASYTENPEILFFEQDYRGQMSTQEILIFDNLPRLKQLQYLFNAKSAIEKAQSMFPTSLLNGSGDAFRHAYFSALNAKVLGVQLAKQLGDAHETFHNSNSLENQMDLFNNQIGRDKYVYLLLNGHGGSFFKEAIIMGLANHYIPNGELRQISPLGANSEILPSSQLVPTN